LDCAEWVNSPDTTIINVGRTVGKYFVLILA
jgi:hypothetical protein